jgi:hypothetical protein
VIPQAGDFENEVSLVALSGKNDGTVLAALRDGLAAVEAKVAFLGGFAVAG